jgi:hypothetical protein
VAHQQGSSGSEALLGGGPWDEQFPIYAANRRLSICFGLDSYGGGGSQGSGGQQL